MTHSYDSSSSTAPRRPLFEALSELAVIGDRLDRLRSTPPTGPNTTSRVNPVEISPEWQALISAARPGEEQVLLEQLARVPALPIPTLGAEAPGGIPIDVAWPNMRLAIALSTLSEEENVDLVRAGWRVVEASAEAVAAWHASKSS